MRRFLIGAMVVVAGTWSGARSQSMPAGFEFQVNTYTTGLQSSPRLAGDAHGNFVVVWQSLGQDGSYGGIFGQRFDSSGTPLGGEIQINSATGGNQFAPAVAMSGLGSFVVVWSSEGSDGDGYGVVGRRFNSSGSPVGGDFQVNTFTTGNQYYPSVASDVGGNFVVAWRDTGVGLRVAARRFDALGNARGGEFAVTAYTSNYQTNAEVAADPPGNFVVTWQQKAPGGAHWSIAARRFDASGAAKTADILVSAYTGRDDVSPTVATAADGSFVVVWGRTGTSYEAHGQRFTSAGAPAGSQFLVGDAATESTYTPRVAGDPVGNFVVVWSEYDGDGQGAAARLFNSAGQKRGPEFAVSTFTTGNQIDPGAFMDADGNFVAAWQSAGQDGSSDGIFAQRYACTDVDGDGICDLQDVILTSPLVSDTVPCADPVNVRPTIQWDGGAFDRFRVLIAADPQFTTTNRVTSGSTLLRTKSYTPPGKKWKKICDKAIAANPVTPQIYFKVYGVDVNVPKSAPNRTSFSQVVPTDAVP